MRLLATTVLAAAATFGLAAPAAAEATPFPVCQDIEYKGRWFGAVCADPEHPCVVYGGGYVWNMCMVQDPL